jgi:hypothetical protein
MRGPGKIVLGGLFVLSGGWCLGLLHASVPERPAAVEALQPQSVLPAPEAAVDAVEPADGQRMQPRVLRRVEPRAPTRLQASRHGVVAVVRAMVRPDGTVAEILSIRSIGPGVDLNDWNLKVADAVQQWRFHPALRDGQPIQAPATLSVRLPGARS